MRGAVLRKEMAEIRRPGMKDESNKTAGVGSQEVFRSLGNRRYLGFARDYERWRRSSASLR
jgi:hypothetical protein